MEERSKERRDLFCRMHRLSISGASRRAFRLQDRLSSSSKHHSAGPPSALALPGLNATFNSVARSGRTTHADPTRFVFGLQLALALAYPTIILLILERA
jgi:hypothetical protein